MDASEVNDDLDRALELIPHGDFVLTTACDGERTGFLVRWIQRCSAEPAMIMVAVPKGLAVEPLMRDSRSFALCQICPDDRLLKNKFAHPPDRNEDPFVTLELHSGPSGSPIISRARSFIDCELVCHMDLEADHRLFVGRVLAAGVLHDGDGAVNMRENGLRR